MDSDDDTETIEGLLQLHPALLLLEDSGRVKCTVTGHEMLAREEVLTQHVNGKKYKRLAKGVSKPFDYTELKPFLLETKKKGYENQLYCKLTMKYINKGPHYIERHIKGKKFLRAKQIWDECEKSDKEFVSPFAKHEKQGKGDADPAMGSVGCKIETNDDDDMSDLYPDEYFSNLTLDSDDSIQREIEASLQEREKDRDSVKKSNGYTKRKTKLTKKQTVPKKRVRTQK